MRTRMWEFWTIGNKYEYSIQRDSVSFFSFSFFASISITKRQTPWVRLTNATPKWFRCCVRTALNRVSHKWLGPHSPNWMAKNEIEKIRYEIGMASVWLHLSHSHSSTHTASQIGRNENAYALSSSNNLMHFVFSFCPDGVARRHCLTVPRSIVMQQAQPQPHANKLWNRRTMICIWYGCIPTVSLCLSLRFVFMIVSMRKRHTTAHTPAAANEHRKNGSQGIKSTKIQF